MFIYRKSKDKSIINLPEDEKNIAQVYIEKHRNGPTGVVNLYFNEQNASFMNIEKNYAESPARIR